MPWMAAAEFVVPKRSPRVLVARCSRLTVIWAVPKVDSHAVQSLALEERPSYSGCCFGKLPAERRKKDAMARSRSYVMGSPVCVAFFWDSSILLIYSGTQGSPFQKSIKFLMRETGGVIFL